MYQVGFGKQKITAFVKGIHMMGWCKPGNYVEGVESDLFARVAVIELGEKKVAIVVTDTAFMTLAIRQKVLNILQTEHATLGYDEHNVMMSCTHTHSAPGGTSHYLIYNLTTPGYSEEVTQTYVQGIVEAILQAEERKQPAQLFYGHSPFAEHIPVAFNRAIEAWNQNPENEKLDVQNRHLAVDRNAYQISVVSLEGTPLGVLNFFAVHTTTVHNDKRLISSDNKGYAAEAFEAAMQAQNPAFVAIFGQGCAGDVSPNFIKHSGDKETRGETPDDFQNRKIHGTYQMEKALELLKNIPHQTQISEQLDYRLGYFDLSSTIVDPEFTDGIEGLRTADPCFGTQFLIGTAEGLGLPKYLTRLVARFAKSRNERLKKRNPYYVELEKWHGEKIIFINHKKGEFAGTSEVHRYPIPSFVDPFLGEIKRLSRAGEFKNPKYPFVPTILPLQVIKIGDIVIAAAPTELTTTCGKRIQKQMFQAFKNLKGAIVMGYTNAYASYTTTPEEYSIQGYEGGSTLFGKYTLPAYQTHFKYLIHQLHKPESQRDKIQLFPPVFVEEDLQNRLYEPFKFTGIVRP